MTNVKYSHLRKMITVMSCEHEYSTIKIDHPIKPQINLDTYVKCTMELLSGKFLLHNT